MSLSGTIKSGGTMIGKINDLKTIHGYSAYELAVIAEGFEGTKEEWLDSLKGEKGEQGKRGERGIQAHYDEETKTLFITGGDEESAGGGETDVGIVSIEQTVTSTVSGGVNEITVTKTDGSKSVLYIRNGGKGEQGNAGDSVVSAAYENGVITFTTFYGAEISVEMPEIVTPDNCYTKSEIDTMFGSYVNAIAEVVGGDV